MNTEDHIVSKPNGITVSEFKKRHKRTAAEALKEDQSLDSNVGLNTSGALSGLRASSFPNPPMGPPTANQAYEELMRIGGRQKFTKQVEATITPKGTEIPKSVQDRPAHFNQLTEAEPAVSEGLTEDLRLARCAKGRPPMWLDPLSRLDPKILSYIGLLCAFNGVLKDWTLNKLTLKMGEMIEQELLLIELMEADAKTNKRIIKQVEKAHSSREVRLKALRNITMKNGFKSLHFGVFTDQKSLQRMKTRRIHYSAPVLNAVLKHCEIFEKVTEFESKNNSISRIVFTEKAQAELQDQEEVLAWMNPLFKPMLTAPAPWTAFDTGCYEDPKLSSRIKLVRQATAAQRKAIEHDFKSGVPLYARAVNALQATPLSINRPMLEVVQWAWDNKKVLEKFPTQVLPDRPRVPDNHEELDPKLKAAIKADIRRHFVLERQVKGGVQVMKQDLATAHELKEHEQFFLPVNLDFRSRLYFCCSFNYHREDWCKSLFTYQRGYKVDGNNAFWLMVHLANCGDFGKISKEPLQARVKWVEDNHDKIISLTENFVETFDDWSQADKPFCYLAACLEYARYCREGEDFVCYVPLSLDGTNSGVQHYSGINLSETEGHLVNLTPSEEMQDIYRFNAEEVVQILGAMTGTLNSMSRDDRAFNENWDESRTYAQLAQAWLNYGVDRKICKRSVMTFGYGSKANGMSGQFMEDVLKPLQRKVAYKTIKVHPFGATDREQFEAARFMGQICYEAIRETLPHTTAAMDYLQGVAKIVSEENKAIVWRTPSGFPIVQEYRKKDKNKRTEIFLFDRALDTSKRTSVGSRIEKPKADVQKSMNAIAPNFVHGSGDASHMHLTICQLLEGRDGEPLAEDFFMVHDSFSISGDTWDLFDTVRDTFVKMYDGDCVLQKFEDEIRQLLNDPSTELPPIPPKGSLNIHGVKFSEFCFS